MRRALLVLVAAALPLAAHAQMYKWKDQYGQIHFTQLPPKDAKAEIISGPPPPSLNPNQDALNKSLGDAQKASPEKQKSAEVAAQQQAQRQENCRQAIERVAYLDAHTPRRLATKDESGNVSRMSDEEFARQRAAEQDRIKQNCD